MDIQSIIPNIPWWFGFAIITGIVAIIGNHLIGPWIKEWQTERKKKKEYKAQIKERVKELIDMLEKCHYYPVGCDSWLVLQRPDADLKLSRKLDEKINGVNKILITYRTLFMYTLILIERELRNFVVSIENRKLNDEFLKKQDCVTPLNVMTNLILEFPNKLTQKLIPLIFSEEKIDDSSLRTINIEYKQYLGALLNDDDTRSRLITKLRDLKNGRDCISIDFGTDAHMRLPLFEELKDKRVELIKHLVELEKLLINMNR